MTKKKKNSRKVKQKTMMKLAKNAKKTNFSNRLLIDIEPMHLVAIFTEISLF